MTGREAKGEISVRQKRDLSCAAVRDSQVEGVEEKSDRGEQHSWCKEFSQRASDFPPPPPRGLLAGGESWV